MACSSMAGVMQYAGVHGGGSPMMEEIAVVGTYDIQEKKELAKHVAAIEGQEGGPGLFEKRPGCAGRALLLRGHSGINALLGTDRTK